MCFYGGFGYFHFPGDLCIAFTLEMFEDNLFLLGTQTIDCSVNGMIFFFFEYGLL